MGCTNLGLLWATSKSTSMSSNGGVYALSDRLALKVYIILNKSFVITYYWKDCVWKSRFHFGNFIVLHSHELIAPCEFSILYVFCSILVKSFAILHIHLMCKNRWNSFRIQKSCYGIVHNFLENIYPCNFVNSIA